MESLWKKTEKTLLDDKEGLKNQYETEICIVGGGITGISTAYYLTKKGKKVILLEREELAEKATGNTTAKITSQHGLFYDYLIENNGKDFAKKYYMANQEAIRNIEKIIQEENIECDYEKQSAYVFTQDAKEVEKIRKEIKAIQAIGGEAEFKQEINPKLDNIQRSDRI